MKYLQFLSCMLLVVGTAAPAHAYTCVSGGSEDCAIWCEEQPVTYEIGALPEGMAETDVENAIQEAAGLWNAVACDDEITLEYVGRTPGGGQTAEIEVRWLTDWDATLGGPTTSSVALASWGTDDCMRPSAISFNDVDFEWNVDGTVTDSQRDITTDAAVQFGRMLGLGNSDQPDQSILTSDAAEEPITELGSDDETGLCAIYEGRQIAGGDAGMEADAGESDMGPVADMGNPEPDMSAPSTDTGNDEGGGGDAGGGGNDAGGGGNDADVVLVDSDPEAGCCATIRPTRSSGVAFLAALMLLGAVIRRRS